jgi:hypothetical protein
MVQGGGDVNSRSIVSLKLARPKDPWPFFAATWKASGELFSTIFGSSFLETYQEIFQAFRVWFCRFYLGPTLQEIADTSSGKGFEQNPAWAGKCVFWFSSALLRDLVLRQGLLRLNSSRRTNPGKMRTPDYAVIESGPTHLVNFEPALHLLAEQGYSGLHITYAVDDRILCCESQEQARAGFREFLVADSLFPIAMWPALFLFRSQVLQKIVSFFRHQTPFAFCGQNIRPVISSILIRPMFTDLPATFRSFCISRILVERFGVKRLISPVDGYHRHAALIDRVNQAGGKTLQIPHGIMNSDWHGFCFVPRSQETWMWTPQAMEWLPKYPNFEENRKLISIPPISVLTEVNTSSAEKFDAVIFASDYPPQQLFSLKQAIGGLRKAGFGSIAIRSHPKEPPGVKAVIRREFSGVTFLPREEIAQTIGRAPLLLHLCSTTGVEILRSGKPCICVLEPDMHWDHLFSKGLLGIPAGTEDQIAEAATVLRKNPRMESGQVFTSQVELAAKMAAWLDRSYD